MILCIAEKPSVAREIARVLGATEQRDGHLAGTGYAVSWTYGHLCTLREPQDYDPALKIWSISALPILPPRFGIKLIPGERIERQFNVIRSLVNQADEVVNCGDAGQEGELIQRWVLQMAGCHKPVRRLWISSLTEEAIREGFNNLRPAADFDRLYHAGLARAIGDWLLGINGTRVYTVKFSQRSSGVLSIGRVQTPTLAMIVNRCREIDSFVPTPFWELKTTYRDTPFAATHGRYDTPDEALATLRQIENRPLTIRSIARKEGREAPPRLFDLTSLQVECNRRFGLSADQTLAAAQALYEKKVTTYPRVDTTYLPDDLHPRIASIFGRLADSMLVRDDLRTQLATIAAGPIPKSKKVFDNSKITDHHAIIPTGETMASLTQTELTVYDLVVRHTAANFMEAALVATTRVDADVPDDAGRPVVFRANGRTILKPGWRVLFPKPDKPQGKEGEEQEKPQDKEGELAVLPDFREGESGPHRPEVVQKKTNPPKLYTEATLLRAMETAGRAVDDPELRDALKENGIGRPSTRAAIIELLVTRRYIIKQRKNLIATERGTALIDTINDPLLSSPALTGQWEHKLRLIERGEYDAATFVSELRDMSRTVVMNALSAQAPAAIVATTDTARELKRRAEARPKRPVIREGMACPLCGQGIIIRGRTALGCSRWREGCTFRAPLPDTGGQ